MPDETLTSTITTTSHGREPSSAAWWLPTGSIRALMALMLVAAVIIGAFWDLSEGKFTALVGLAGAAVGYYFGAGKPSRSGEG